MSKDFDFSYHENYYISQTNIINNININNSENLSPLENVNYSIPSLASTNNSEFQKKKKKFPNYPIKNIYHPDLFLDQEYLDKFICGICENVCDDPVIQCCGCENLYCRKCLLFYYDHYNRECPECKQVSKEPTKVESAYITIRLKKMKCINYTNNCTWKGRCAEYAEHILNKCPKEIINCPFKGCIIKLRREEMEEHMKICDYMEIACEKCNLKIGKNEKESHTQVCLKEEIKCPQGCDTIIERGDFILHKQTCEFSIIECPFSFLGCPDKFIRKETNFRLNKDMEMHLNLGKEKCLKYEEKCSNYEEIIKGLKEENEILKKTIEELKNERTEIKEESEKEKESNNNEITSSKNQLNDDSIMPNESLPIGKIISLFESENIDMNSKEKESNKDNDTTKHEQQKNEEIKKNYLAKKRKKSHSQESINTNIINNSIDNLNISKINLNNNKRQEDNKDDKEDKEINNNKIIKEDKVNDLYILLELEENLFYINNNTIEAKFLNGKKHYYVFFNQKYDIPKTSSKKYMIKYKLLKDVPWLGIGICDKKIVEGNNFEFTPSKRNDGKTANIGTYMISTNKMAWNCNNNSQCRKFGFTISKKDTLIELIVSPEECEVEFKSDNKTIFKFNDVRCFKADFFSPCLIFLHNCIVETTFCYP